MDQRWSDSRRAWLEIWVTAPPCTVRWTVTLSQLTPGLEVSPDRSDQSSAVLIVHPGIFAGSWFLPESDLNCVWEDGGSILLSLHHRGLRPPHQPGRQYPPQEEPQADQPGDPGGPARRTGASGLLSSLGPPAFRSELDIPRPHHSARYWVLTSLVHSHWSRNVEVCLSLVESVAAPALLCHKEPARRIQSPLLGALERKIPLGGYFACSSLVLYGIRIGGFHARKGSIMGRPLWHKRAGVAIPRLEPRHRGGPVWYWPTMWVQSDS